MSPAVPPNPAGFRLQPPPPRPRTRGGVALVIVLAFVVLITGLIVAYFSRSMNGRQLSNSSAGQTKSALLAQSASDFVIAGLKREIAAGSSPTPVPAGSPYSYYPPSAPRYAVPVRYPLPSPNTKLPFPNDPIPNLVRWSSQYDNAIPAPGVSSLASAVNTTTNPAVNGRAVSTTRWNSHYLIPCADGATDSTPDGVTPMGTPTASKTTVNFVSPDWVLMTRNGPALETGIGTGATALSNSAPSNQNYAVGRYAYAVYDEGGLLDVNVAGHPAPASSPVPSSTTVPVPTPPTSLPFSTTQLGQKSSLAMADLTQLPIVRLPTSPDPTLDAGEYLPQTAVDALVGWRNYASSTQTGTFPAGLGFSASQASQWFGTFAFNNPGGYLKTYGVANSATTDQSLLSRQALLKLRASIGFSPNALQYLGTFSRSVEQPSYIPAHITYGANSTTQEAPNINALGSTVPPLLLSSGGAEDNYKGNNDAAGTSGSSSIQDLYNPALLSVRVTKSFLRFDLNQTTAVVGEPLLKKKFPLNRLGEITYLMTDSSQSITDPGFAPKAGSSNPGAKNHIKDWFGLSRASASAPWTYNHGNNYIMSLSQVADAGRDPDFAELLKAAINVGSLAKGGPNLNVSYTANYQYVLDTTVDYQVLQIMANEIDQYDADSFPTIIQIAVGGLFRTFRGVEDLPYFYRYHPFSVVTRQPNPMMLATSNVVSFTTPGGIRAPSPCAPVEKFSTGLVDGGNAVALYIPEVWNPHDANTQITYPNTQLFPNQGRPIRYRLSVITDDPALPIPQTPAWQTGFKSQVSSDWYDDIPPKASIPENVRALSDPASAGSDSTAFTFTDDGGKLFREPTLLWRTDVPTNINLQPDTGSLAGPYTDVNTQIKYYGVQIGQGAVSYKGTVSHTTYPASPQSPTDTYIFQATAANAINTKPPAANLQYTFRLQYSDPVTANNWITYDEKYPDIHGLYQSTLVVNPADYTGSNANRYWDPLQNIDNANGTNQLSDTAAGYDPRTARYGISTADEAAELVEPQEPTAAGVYGTSNYKTLGQSNFTVFYTQRAFTDLGNKDKYSNPCMTSNPGRSQQMRWFSGAGYSASNGVNGAPLLWGGVLFEQNDPSVAVPNRGSSSSNDQRLYYEDADGVARRAMGAFAYSFNSLDANGSVTAYNAPPASGGRPYSNPEGLPLAWADNMTNTGTVLAANVQNLSRPFILNRPFRNVGEMAYASRGSPWKQIDFFTPESGDTALLDVFCINELPDDALTAGKVNLNTHQVPVIQAIVANATRDELATLPPNANYTPPSYALAPLTATEANNVAKKLVNVTTAADGLGWHLPMMNVGDLVGRYVNGSFTNSTQDLYSFKETVTNKYYNYSGLSPALDLTTFTTPAQDVSKRIPYNSYRIQRMHESAVRALASSGQTRVWNLMIDVIAQTGRYAPTATTLAQFSPDGESRYWVHVAIDRYTGQIIDKQIELVTE